VSASETAAILNKSANYVTAVISRDKKRCERKGEAMK